jgi:hypothetical protein
VLHTYALHASSAGHVTAGVYAHVLSEHESAVHALLSLHTLTSSVAFKGRVPHPSVASQNATKHLSPPLVQPLEMSVYTHALASQSSLVHSLLSSHSIAISAGPFFCNTQPSASSHVASWHMSADVHVRMVVLAQKPVVPASLTHVNCVHNPVRASHVCMFELGRS